jgi:uncharacterized protein YndB with AHSA1/START domain
MSSELQTVRVTRTFRVSAERVYDAWLDPAKVGRFLFATPTGQMVKVELDPRVGGSFRFVDRRDGQDVEHHGRYLALDRPRSLAFDFWLDDERDKTRVTVTIVPAGAGCELTLVHERVEAAYAERTQCGWTTILESLATAVA